MRILPAKQLLIGMTTATDLMIDNKVVLKQRTILTEKNIKNIIDYYGEQYLVWVYDLMELKQSIFSDTKVANEYIDYVVAFYRQLLNKSVTDNLKFFKLCTRFKEYLGKNRSALFDLFVLRERHSYTFEHSINVAVYATMIGLKMGLSDNELYNLVLGSLLHDLGKLKISNNILDKPTKLTEIEFEAIKQHPHYGLLLTKDLVDLTPEMHAIIEQHHEKLDGTGYPYKLKDREISYLAKIVTVCDIFDAVTSKRSYHKPLSCDKGIDLLKKEIKNQHISKEIVNIFEPQLTMYYKNTYVTLNNGELCLILNNTKGKKKPIVLSCVTKQIYDLNKSDLYIVRGTVR